MNTSYQKLLFGSGDDPDKKKLRIAHTGARYEISDIREICGVGTRNSARSSGGSSAGGGAQSAPFWRRVRPALAPRRLAGNPRRSLFRGWALPQRNVFGGWHRQKEPGREKCRNYFGFRKTRVCVTPGSLHRVEEWVLLGLNRRKQSYHGSLYY